MRREAIYAKQLMERRLRMYTQFWLVDPQVLDEDTNEASWMNICVEYVSSWLAQAPFLHFTTDAMRATGQDNAALAQLDLAREICSAAFRARRRVRSIYHTNLRRLRQADRDEWQEEMVWHER